jgi:hypothetical protein
MRCDFQRRETGKEQPQQALRKKDMDDESDFAKSNDTWINAEMTVTRECNVYPSDHTLHITAKKKTSPSLQVSLAPTERKKYHK